jgi:hypothetical protein
MHLARNEDRNRILNACVSQLGAQGSESAGGRAAGGLVAAVQVDRAVVERDELERRTCGSLWPATTIWGWSCSIWSTLAIHRSRLSWSVKARNWSMPL